MDGRSPKTGPIKMGGDATATAGESRMNPVYSAEVLNRNIEVLLWPIIGHCLSDQV
jgi:hypothetical protein